MFHLRPKRTMRKMMNMEMPDMDMQMPEMTTTTKVLVAGAMIYFGTKMLMDEFMD